MNENKIEYGLTGNKCVIKMTGKIRQVISPGLDAIIKQVMDEGIISSFLIDLRETIYIDSTNLGLIAGIARYTRANGYERPIIISVFEDVNTVLFSMGFDAFFDILDSYDELNELKTSPDIQTTRSKKGEIILRAHETLMVMNDSNEAEFRNVVDLMRSDIGL